ncbi:glycosyltransferase family 2 protein [Pedobacter nototheniae]|uniref:glycosyltransferase family 2 protein n=1 Tax=Pedobacter nototheniae TaxID=2488994 RepID=UPI002931EDE8|nr:glycosyltransferase family 2 protein [Pedobacter nototheniae]
MSKQRVNWPKISIVTTNLNQDAYLEKTILSVTEQGYPNLEYIIIDGKSSDSSVDIIKKHEAKIAYWCTEEDRGLYYALNKGFEKATGEILMWINSDDLLNSGALFNVAEIFNAFPQVDWITGINISFDEKGRVIGADRAIGFTKYDFYTHNYQWLQQESTAWRKNLWEKAGGCLNIDYKYAADFDLWIRFFKFSNLYPCDVLIGGFRMRSANQLSLNFLNTYQAEVNKIIDKEKKDLPPSILNDLRMLKAIKIIRLVLKYSILFDLKIFSRILNKLERNLLKKPATRIHINRLNCQFEMI